MLSTDMNLDVTSAAGLGDPIHIAATLHLPDGMEAAGHRPGHLLLAIHGGGYRRAYWNPPFADESYSFARWFTSRGKAVLAIDMLGMGESGRPEPESRLNFEMFAACHAEALRQIIEGWSGPVSVTGIGHSMGGMAVISQAAALPGAMDRVAVLGWANEPMVLGDTDVATLQEGLAPGGYIATERGPMRALFYAADVPTDLIEADEALGSTTPATLGSAALTPGIVHDAAARIAVPVLVVQSAVDTSPAPESEPAYFSSSPDVELQILEDAAHCQNFAGTRQVHWQRLNDWIERTTAKSS